MVSALIININDPIVLQMETQMVSLPTEKCIMMTTGTLIPTISLSTYPP